MALKPRGQRKSSDAFTPNHVPALAAARRQRRLLIALLGAALIAIMLLLSSQLWSGYGEALREAAKTTQNYAAVIEARLDATLRRTDSVLRLLEQEIPAAVLNKAAVAHHATQFNAHLDRHLIGFPELAGLRVFDAHGDLLYASTTSGVPRASIADRNYFRQVRDNPRAGLVFSEVLTSAATGRQSVIAARALRDAQGQTAAVVLALMEIEYFKQLFQSLDLGPSGVTAIRRSDDLSGVVRWPALEGEINRPLPVGNPFRKAIQAGQPVGTLEFVASSDGVKRIYSYRSVAGFPFAVFAAAAHDDVLADWRSRSIAVGVAAVFILALFAWLLARLWRMEAREARVVIALEGSEERLRLALEAGNLGLYDLNVQTGDAAVNAQYALMLGYDPQQFRETNAAWIERLHPDDSERVAQAYRDYVAGRLPDYRVEFRQRTRDGQYKWILSIGKVVERDAEGQPLRMLGTHLDISERKHAESTLKNLNAELESRVQQRTAELINARDTAERANRAKSEFLSSMSHELRTPMNAILGFGQMLAADLTQAWPDKQRRYLQEIVRAGQHLLELIEDLLDLARIEAGKQEIHMQTVPLPALIQDCLRLVEPLARESGVRLLPGAPTASDHSVAADPTRLKQVLLNLLSNAIKYNRDQGSVQVSCASEGNAVRIDVVDTGVGLGPEQQQRLFKSFERLGADKSTVKGAGIGLALSKRLVELMCGEIGVTSQVGKGSTFWVRLASVAAAAAPNALGAPRALLPAANAVPQSTRTVLYIEDDAVNVLLMEAVLCEQPGLRLISAPLPGLGLDIARAERPDLILLDIQLPGMDGYEVMRRLRADESTLTIPVIAITANAMPDDIQRGLAAGFSDYIAKPLDIPRLLAAIDRALQAEPAL